MALVIGQVSNSMINDIFVVKDPEIGSSLMLQTPLVSALLSDIVQLLYGLNEFPLDVDRWTTSGIGMMETTNALIHPPSQEQQIMHGLYHVFPAFFLDSIDHQIDERFHIYLFRFTQDYRLFEISVKVLDILVGQCGYGVPGSDIAVVQEDTSSAGHRIILQEIQ